MSVINLYEAKTQLSQLVDRAAGGEEIIIAKAGRPLARLVPFGARLQPRPLRLFRGRVRMGEGFDDPLPEAMGQGFLGETA